MDMNELEELLKSIRNRCFIAAIIIHEPHLLPTILEDLYEDAQTIVMEYCVKETS